MSGLKYLSVCSGIEAATVAWHDMGWKAVGYSEIEKFPSQLLNHHYPNVTNYGDMTKFKEWNINESIDLLVGGTPCQSFSIAGLRKGLEDPRGNLMLTYLAMANHFKPKWLLWENVPGVLSSNRGHDFATLLQGLAELGYGFAYRVLDAQHFGVPQRRRRVFVVGCLGDWRSAAKVLFESESLCRDITPRRSERKNNANKIEGSVELSSPLAARDYKDAGTDGMNKNSAKLVIAPDIANCLTKSPSSYSSYNPARSEGNAVVTMVYETHPADSRVKEMGETCQTVTSRWGTGGGNVPIALAENTIGRQPLNGGNGNGFTEGGPMYTLNATGVHGIACDTYNGTIQGDVTATMTFSMAGSSSTKPKVMQSMQVRRLTPTECERLQGFPDNYTNTPTSSDATRYKALGNSMAVPVMKWIGNRINAYVKA
jgi:DNA (cytosine-5)-methyltransferase 1